MFVNCIKCHIVNIYCADCKIVVCAMCFIDYHKNHEGSHVNKFVDGFRKQIESNVEAINEYISRAKTKKVRTPEDEECHTRNGEKLRM